MSREEMSDETASATGVSFIRRYYAGTGIESMRWRRGFAAAKRPLSLRGRKVEHDIYTENERSGSNFRAVHR